VIRLAVLRTRRCEGKGLTWMRAHINVPITWSMIDDYEGLLVAACCVKVTCGMSPLYARCKVDPPGRLEPVLGSSEAVVIEA
jgi:hypothetical protein